MPLPKLLRLRHPRQLAPMSDKQWRCVQTQHETRHGLQQAQERPQHAFAKAATIAALHAANGPLQKNAGLHGGEECCRPLDCQTKNGPACTLKDPAIMFARVGDTASCLHCDYSLSHRLPYSFSASPIGSRLQEPKSDVHPRVVIKSCTACTLMVENSRDGCLH